MGLVLMLEAHKAVRLQFISCPREHCLSVEAMPCGTKSTKSEVLTNHSTRQSDANTLSTHFASMSTDPSYKTPPTKVSTINSHYQHQQITPYSVLHMLHPVQVQTIYQPGFQTIHTLKTLRSHGLRGIKLFDITESLIISRIKYVAPSWCGFATQQQLQQLQFLIKKLIRFNYLPASYPTVTQIFNTLDSRLFKKVENNNHCCSDSVLLLCVGRAKSDKTRRPSENRPVNFYNVKVHLDKVNMSLYIQQGALKMIHSESKYGLICSMNSKNKKPQHGVGDIASIEAITSVLVVTRSKREYLLTKRLIPKTATQESEISLPAYSPTDDVDCDARDTGIARVNCDASDNYDARFNSDARGICDARDNYDARENRKARDNYNARVDVQKNDEKVSKDKLDKLEKDLNKVTTDRIILKSEGQSHQQELEEIEKPKQEHTNEMKEQKYEKNMSEADAQRVPSKDGRKGETVPRIGKGRAKSPPRSTAWCIGYENEKTTQQGELTKSTTIFGFNGGQCYRREAEIRTSS
ncbi:hypothetical protein HELRODRAFT_174297 [Helobdella robusta]|uniref:Uncharacterized protein n=1 Tax=Helobdella robusta TaxID=6412 RepID=T1F7Y5_HELRO|nr:hypothetical protein HELRODRAFT_174297 [Helobdella robusta]ESO02860.1 hypothetical protein HELRODRAFT_174297 [Helobdella robusta]